MNTQNDIAAWIIEQLPGSKIVKRPKRVSALNEQPSRWEGRIADSDGKLHTVAVTAGDPPSLEATPYLGYSAE